MLPEEAMEIKERGLEKRNLPWVEKYRPKSLDELVSQKEIISTLNKLIIDRKLPHLLFYGPPGTGKTTTILAAARMLFSPKEMGSMVLELNASDDRGIGVVREEILNFASARGLDSIFGGTKEASKSAPFKLIILDEADAMTKDAQAALRRIMEKYTSTVRFCLICNYLSKLIPALQSRCTRFRFPPLQPNQMLPRLRAVAEAEKLEMGEDGEKALLALAQGDMRRVLNVLQSTSMAFGKVNEANVYTCVGHPTRQDIRSVTEALLNLKVKEAEKKISAIKETKGLALSDLITEIHNYVHRLEIPEYIKLFLVAELGDQEYRLSKGASEKVQLGALIATFQLAREMISREGPSQQNEDDQLFSD